MELIVFPDAEQLALDALTAGFAAVADVHLVHAFGRVPALRPKEFVRVIRTGGPVETLVTENVQLTVEAWAQDEVRAYRIAAIASAVLRAQDGDLRGVQVFSGPQNLPDPTTDQVRYTFACSVRVRGSALA